MCHHKAMGDTEEPEGSVYHLEIDKLIIKDITGIPAKHLGRVVEIVMDTSLGSCFVHTLLPNLSCSQSYLHPHIFGICLSHWKLSQKFKKMFHFLAHPCFYTSMCISEGPSL